MALIGEAAGGRTGSASHEEEGPRDPNVADMFQRLNLTAEEEEIMEFSDDEDGGTMHMLWALVGKILSPNTCMSPQLDRR